MNYKETLTFLYSRLPMFQRIGPAAYKTDLTNTVEICARLGNPQEGLKFIHIAGTNGKGSVSHFLAAILQKAGYKTGLYTSPHLKDFRERIRIDGKMIAEGKVVELVDKNREKLNDIHPSFFEYTFGMALEYFKDEQVDIAVLETGMGGRLDSTNIVTPLVTVITNIGMDHAAFLGDTLAKIAREKAGIIKDNIPVVIGTYQDETAEIFEQIAGDKKSTLTFADKRFKLAAPPFQDNSGYLVVRLREERTGNEIKLLSGLPGAYQASNIPAVLETLSILEKQGIQTGMEDIKTGMKEVKELTGITGRWQELAISPRVICDIGHNADGIRANMEQLSRLSFKRLHFVFGTVDDKDPENILKLLPADAVYYFCKANIPRGMDAVKLKKLGEQYGLNGKSYHGVTEAYKEAIQNADPGDLVFVGGSTFVVAEVL